MLLRFKSSYIARQLVIAGERSLKGERTLLRLLWLELGKGRLGITRTAMSLPFPVHGAFVRSFGLNVAEHGGRVVSISRQKDVVARAS